MSAAASLTGIWDGEYRYPRLLAPNAFTAILFETAGHLGGQIHEVAATGATRGQTVTAALVGHRAAQAVSFVKTYDPEGRRHKHPVRYEGALDAEACRIEGRWRIAGSWGGDFVMTRARPAAERVAVKRSEEIDA